jgi:hypothetical protein
VFYRIVLRLGAKTTRSYSHLSGVAGGSLSRLSEQVVASSSVVKSCTSPSRPISRIIAYIRGIPYSTG